MLFRSSADELVRRLQARRTEAPNEMVKRLQTAIRELKQAEAFDHVVVNDNLDIAVVLVHTLVGTPERAPDTTVEQRRIQTLIAELTQKTKEIS